MQQMNWMLCELYLSKLFEKRDKSLPFSPSQIMYFTSPFLPNQATDYSIRPYHLNQCNKSLSLVFSKWCVVISTNCVCVCVCVCEV